MLLTAELRLMVSRDHAYCYPDATPTFTADTDGMVKVLSDAKTDRILGVHIIGSVSKGLIGLGDKGLTN